MNKKGAIELSVNFFVVIIISFVVLVGGLTLFYKMIDRTKEVAATLDQQTEMKIKDMMLSGNLPVLAYPQDAVIKNGESKIIGVGVTNNLDTTRFHVNITKIVKYPKGVTAGINISYNQFLKYYLNLSDYTMNIKNGDRSVKSFVLMMPKDAAKAQYVYTINISSIDASNVMRQYGVVQIYVTNP